MTPWPGRALQMAAIVGLASPGCNVMFYAPFQLISDRTFSSTTLVIPDQQRDRPRTSRIGLWVVFCCGTTVFMILYAQVTGGAGS